MKVLKIVPTLAISLIAYHVLIFLQNREMLRAFEPMWSINLLSGANLSFSPMDFVLILGIVCLFFEVIKSAIVKNHTIIEHSFSMLLFILFLFDFLFIEAAGTKDFLLLTLMTLLDVMAGFSITIISSRRDISVEGR